MLNSYLTQIRMNLLLTLRNRVALFFSYIFPLIFFGIAGMGGGGGNGQQVVTIVLGLGVLGGGLFGVGMRAIQDREQNILRRFKVAPIGPGEIIVSGLVTALTLQLPNIIFMVVLAHRLLGAPWPTQPVSLLVFVSLGLLAFASLGGIIAALVNSMQEGMLLTQLFYFPLLFLGGITFPITGFPLWLQTVAQFIPSTYFSSGLQPILRGKETIFDNLPAAGALAVTALLGTLLAAKLFRWEKEEKLRPAAKFWLLAVLGPFIVLGAWQMHAKTNIAKQKILGRDVQRSRTALIRDARLFLGDGTVIDQGSVLIKDGKIAEIFTGPAPDAKSLRADAIEAAGKTLLPGLIDVHVHFGSPGLPITDPQFYQNPDANFDRELAAYLFSGVTAVKSAGDQLDMVLKHQATVASGERLGAELFAVGPLFTTAGGHGTEYSQYIPESFRANFDQQFIRLPKSAEEARTQVNDLKQQGVDGIKAVLEGGGGGTTFNRMDPAILKAISDAAHAAKLPIVTHTGNAQDVTDALDAGVDGIEHGSMRDRIPDAEFTKMKAMGVTFDPTLSVLEAMGAYVDGKTDLLDRSLVQQVVPRQFLAQVKDSLNSPGAQAARKAIGGYPMRLDLAKLNLAAAYHAGVILVTGTDSGNPMVVHGPSIHRELQLWVEAGIPPSAALQGATYNAAKLLRADQRIGLIRKGYDASLLLVDGNPLQDISATERISAVFLKGERVNRSDLFDQK
ncbi:MAG: amidohydrolase family protein [Acidobacteriia bacterium]|nr:amidohydrolase family protein [Terriglobia bacterium]